MSYDSGDMRYRYPRYKFPKRDREHLRLTLHGENLVDVYTKESDNIQALVSFREHQLVSMTLTPIRIDQSLPEILEGITSLLYENPGSRMPHDKHFVVLIGASGSAAAVAAWDADAVERVFTYPAGTVENRRIVRLLKDLEAHRTTDADVFVTEDDEALAFRDWIQDRIPILILSVLEALDYLDVHLKRHGEYLYDPHRRIRGNWFYYWERLCELLPTFPMTWAATVFAVERLPNGEQVQSYLRSLSTRLVYMFEPKDEIASRFYKRSDGQVQCEMLRELNYFMTLTTGSFDALAWLLRYFYEFRPADSEQNQELRQRVVLKLRPRQSTNGLINHVEARNKRLGSYLRSDQTQKLMSIFYPSRDSIQHRHPLSGLQYIRAMSSTGKRPIRQSEEDTAYSLAILDVDTEQAISRLDSDDLSDYFTCWGMRKVYDQAFLEPYKFVVQALRKVVEFHECVLQLLAIYSSGFLMAKDLSRIKDSEQVRASRRQKFLVPFLLTPKLPPINPGIPRMPIPGVWTPGEAKSDESMALYGTHPLFVEVVRQGSLKNY
jgi:hypothetical protein